MVQQVHHPERSRRVEQVNALLHEELSIIIARDIEFEPDVFVTITKVETAADLGHANVFISVFPFEKRERILKILRKSLREIQKTFFSKVAMNPVPKIHFRLDETEEHAEHIEEVLDKIKQ